MIIKEIIKDTFRVYSLTLLIPIITTIILLFIGIIGLELKYGFLGTLEIIWVDYYYSGILLELPAWRWQLSGLFISFIISVMINVDKKY